ncbi:MAG: hypothetical protein JWN34_3834 [Bryobacterales bacterium]|nr:hypothetical protein [Bryobacterales bacterium]
MPNLLPFRAFYSNESAIYIPGEEAPRLLDPATLTAYPHPALFLYSQSFGDQVRYGVTGLLNRAEATVFPHEEVSPERVAACAGAIAAARTDPGSLWLWCHDLGRNLRTLLRSTDPPFRDATDTGGVLHQVWPVTDPAEIDSLQVALAGKELFLADGHHRFAAGWDLATIQIRGDALRTRAPRRAKLVNGIEDDTMVIDEIERAAREGILLPAKSTDFYPKLAAGLVIRS